MEIASCQSLLPPRPYWSVDFDLSKVGVVNNKNNDDISMCIYYMCVHSGGSRGVEWVVLGGGSRGSPLSPCKLEMYNRSYVKADYLIVQELAN